MGKHSTAPLSAKRGLQWWTVRVVAALSVVSVGAVALGAVIGDDDRQGEVVRVIDGDTLVALIAGEETTIRLLNVDAPETKHPDLPVQCLGPEATDFLAERLPAGTEIELEYDEERLDRYDRTLAGVYESGSLINAEIAAEGLGVPVLVEPNDRFLSEVEEAAATAEAEGLGLFAASVACTVTAQVETLAAAVDQFPATVEGDPAQAVADAAAVVEVAEGLVDALDATALAGGTNAVLALPLVGAYVDAQREAAEEARDRAVEGRERLQGLKDHWDEEQERLREEKERREREEREREERERREREEREREERERREREERQAQEQREREAAPAPQQKSGSGGGSSSCVPYGPEISYADDGGYTGKRYGMPGGKTFRKCS